jgi:hypothetical protein
MKQLDQSAFACCEQQKALAHHARDIRREKTTARSSNLPVAPLFCRVQVKHSHVISQPVISWWMQLAKLVQKWV